jgi:hypothetical protein
LEYFSEIINLTLNKQVFALELNVDNADDDSSLVTVRGDKEGEDSDPTSQHKYSSLCGKVNIVKGEFDISSKILIVDD